MACEWIWRTDLATAYATIERTGCPQCGFGHYGAHYALGPICYRASKTQEPWIQRKLERYERRLRAHAKTHSNIPPPAWPSS